MEGQGCDSTWGQSEAAFCFGNRTVVIGSLQGRDKEVAVSRKRQN